MSDLFEIIRQTGLVETIKQNPEFIDTIDEPIELLQMTAIKYCRRGPTILTLIKDLSKNAQMLAVTRWNGALAFIKKPSYTVLFQAVSSHAHAIGYIKTPSRRLQLMAISQNPSTIIVINNPCLEAEMLAWEKGRHVSRNPCEEIRKLLSIQNEKRFKKDSLRHNRKVLQSKICLAEKKATHTSWRKHNTKQINEIHI